MLRSVGLNVVLAWAGYLCELIRFVCPADVGASMRVQDSIQDGKSRFYAEITRSATYGFVDRTATLSAG